MTNAEFAIAVNKFFYFANNLPTKAITYKSIDGTEKTKYAPSFFECFEPWVVEHLLDKWAEAYYRHGCYGCMNAFYEELDGGNRYRLLKWVNENYEHRNNFGISIPSKEKLGEWSEKFVANLGDLVRFYEDDKALYGEVVALDDDGYITIAVEVGANDEVKEYRRPNDEVKLVSKANNEN